PFDSSVSGFSTTPRKRYGLPDLDTNRSTGKPFREQELRQRFGLEPAGTAAAGGVTISMSSVRTYPGGPLTQCSVDREPTAPADEFMNLFEGMAGLPSWHLKILSTSPRQPTKCV
ncbi:RPL10, partial [Symbiodinium pilosum]